MPQATLGDVLGYFQMAGMIGIKTKLFVIALALSFAFGTAGQDDQPAKVVETRKQPSVATDIYGDPLPEGAIARLGTERFRHGTSAICAVAYSPDGKVVASTGLRTFGICLWDADTGRPLHRLGTPPIAWSIAFSPDSKLLFNGADLSLIDVKTGKQVRRFNAPTKGSVLSVAFSPDGKSVAGGESGAPSDVFIWDSATSRLLHTLKGHTSGVRAVAYSPDGKMLATGGQDNMIRFWDTNSGNEIRRLEGHDNTVHVIAFSPDGKTLASGGEESSIRLWDSASGKLLRLFKNEGMTNASLAFSPDGKQLAFGGSDNMIRLCNPDTGQEIRRWDANHGWITSLAFSPNGKVLASGGVYYSAIRRWDVATGKAIDHVDHTSWVGKLRIAPDGKTLFSFGHDRKVLEWDLSSGRERGRLFGEALIPYKENWSWTGLDLSPDGKVAAMVGTRFTEKEERLRDEPIRLIDTTSGKELQSLSGHRHDGYLTGRFSPDGKLLASTGDDGLRVWNVATGKVLRHLQEPQVRFGSIAFSRDSKWLAYAGSGFGTRIWLMDLATGKPVHNPISTSPHGIGNLVFSPDAKSIASSNPNGVQVWDTASGKALMRFESKNPPQVNSLAFSPTGRVLAVGANALQLLEVSSGELIRQIETPQGQSSSVAFTPDGRCLASGGYDSTVLLWDLTGSTANGKSKTAPLTAKNLDSLWLDLSGDAAKADKAIWKLALAPSESTPFLKRLLQPAAPADAREIAKLVAALDDNNFAVRQKSAKTLDDLGEAAEAALRKILKTDITLEVRQRIDRILEKRDKEILRKLRAIEVVELIATPEARQIIQELTSNSPNPGVVEAANAAINRLSKRQQ